MANMSQATNVAIRALDGTESRWNKIKEPCGYVNASITEMAGRIANSEAMNHEKKLELLEKMKQCAVELSKIEAEADARRSASKEMSRQLNAELNNNAPIQDFMDLFHSGVSAAERIRDRHSVNNAESVEIVQKHIATVSGDDDEDDDVAAIATNIEGQIKRCPYTGKPIENPVKNKNCGHVLSLEGAIALLCVQYGGSRRLPTKLSEVPDHLVASCPTVGCTSNINSSSLERDFRTERSQRQAQTASARRDSMDTSGIEVLDC